MALKREKKQGLMAKQGGCFVESVTSVFFLQVVSNEN